MSISIKQKIRTVAKLLSNPSELSALLSLRHSGYLMDTGWFNSFNLKEPLNKNSEPIPWFTYPSIVFLAERLKKNLSVFEYGSGNSTLFFSKYCKKVISIEQDTEWFQKISLKKPENVSLFLQSESTTYSYSALNSGEKFEIIIDDGNDRVKVILNSLNALSEEGVFILDDSERLEYKSGINFLIENEFKRLDFWGMAPGLLYTKCTSLFYRNINCLGI